MTEGVIADLLIRSKCTFGETTCRGFVFRLSRSEALFVSREAVPDDERGILELLLPWHLGRVELPVVVGPPRGGWRRPVVTLVFPRASREQLDGIERYLARYHLLLAELEE